MSTHSVATPRYVLTDAGRELLRHHEPCLCEVKFEGLLLACRHCGTIYGHMNQLTLGGYGRAKPE